VSNNATANINSQSAGTITNNVNVKAVSGDASAKDNTKVGDVSSGDAKAATGVANIFNSALNLKHWFGVLVINVFGDWLGDVNDDTPAGTVASDASSQQASDASSLPRVFMARIYPGSTSTPLLSGIPAVDQATGGGSAGAGTSVNAQGQSQVLTASASRPDGSSSAGQKGTDASVLFGLSAVVMLIAGGLAGLEKRLKRSK
jgi:hypothetical protein